MSYLGLNFALPILMASTFATQAMADDYFDNAPVLSVTPQVERVNTPRQECHTEYVRESYSNNSSPAGAIIGGIAGGLLGSTIGKGDGKIAGAAVGAGVGAIVGDRVGNNQANGVVDRPVDRCVTVDNWQNVSRGYLVTYRYNGRDFTTVTDENPGNTIKVRVGVNDANRPAANIVQPSSYTSSTYYSPAPQVVYREPMRVYSPPPVVIYGAWSGGYGHDHRGYGYGVHDRHRW
jgi:uncharacterized protein YcfJ